MSDYVTLLAGLLLPWLVGTLGLVLAEDRLGRNSYANRLRQLGYGFFLGYGVLCMAVAASDELTGVVNWAWIMMLLSVLAAGAAVALLMSHQAATKPHLVDNEPLSRAQKFLLIIFAVWIGLHIGLAAIENISLPIFPWDAWGTWIYRAKAWFGVGSMVDVVEHASWVTEQSPEVYTMVGAGYPLLPSIVPYWTALSLGRWSESLVNLPVLLAAVAMGMALYGQCRESGLSVPFSVAACYLLSSVPLFGTHVSLAGYADIWVAGFSGLGCIALMRGAIARLPFQVLLGLCMLGFGTMVKIEAVAWLLMALLFLVLMTMRARTVLAAAVALAAIGVGLHAVGIDQVDIPALGTVGFADGELQLPFLRPVELEVRNVWEAYWNNFFTMGSWNLLWSLMLCAVLLGILGGSRASARATAAGTLFILMVVASQIFIFGFTEQGAWAKTYTAINRLPLQFTPALIFAALLIVHNRIAGESCATPAKDRGLV